MDLLPFKGSVYVFAIIAMPQISCALCSNPLRLYPALSVQTRPLKNKIVNKIRTKCMQNLVILK